MSLLLSHEQKRRFAISIEVGRQNWRRALHDAPPDPLKPLALRGGDSIPVRFAQQARRGAIQAGQEGRE